MESIKQSIVRKILSVSLIVMTALFALTLSACGGAVENMLRDSATENLERFKQNDETFIVDFLGGSESNLSLSQLNIPENEFHKAWFTDFDYEIHDVTVDGDTANVSVTISAKRLSDVTPLFEDQLETLMIRSAEEGLSQEEAYGKAGELMLEVFASLQPTETKINIPYVKVGNTWELGPEFGYEFNKALIGGV